MTCAKKKDRLATVHLIKPRQPSFSFSATRLRPCPAGRLGRRAAVEPRGDREQRGRQRAAVAACRAPEARPRRPPPAPRLVLPPGHHRPPTPSALPPPGLWASVPT